MKKIITFLFILLISTNLAFSMNERNGSGYKVLHKWEGIYVVEIDGSKVTVRVGDVEHPMLPEHHIAWIVLETKNGFQKKELDPAGKPCAVFTVDGDEAVAAYEYCNLHGLWKKEV